MSKVYITTGASTILAESIFYNVKVRPNTILVCAKSHALSLAAPATAHAPCLGAAGQLDCALSRDRLVREWGGLHALPEGAVCSHLAVCAHETMERPQQRA
jgi:hypothetical protein